MGISTFDEATRLGGTGCEDEDDTYMVEEFRRYREDHIDYDGFEYPACDNPVDGGINGNQK